MVGTRNGGEVDRAGAAVCLPARSRSHFMCTTTAGFFVKLVGRLPCGQCEASQSGNHSFCLVALGSRSHPTRRAVPAGLRVGGVIGIAIFDGHRSLSSPVALCIILSKSSHIISVQYCSIARTALLVATSPAGANMDSTPSRSSGMSAARVSDERTVRCQPPVAELSSDACSSLFMVLSPWPARPPGTQRCV
jgi:hypothetical protein